MAKAIFLNCSPYLVVHGQLTNEVQNGVAIARTYDTLNRPTGYTIMRNGGGNNPVNPVETSYACDSLGRFASNAEVVVTDSCAYDHRGRMVRKEIFRSGRFVETSLQKVPGRDAPTARPQGYALAKTITYIRDNWNIIREIQWPVASGQWSVVSGQWSVASGQWSVVADGTSPSLPNFAQRLRGCVPRLVADGFCNYLLGQYAKPAVERRGGSLGRCGPA